jgi:parallel beta-helix repeat protein
LRINKQIIIGTAILVSLSVSIAIPIYFAVINRTKYTTGDPIIIWNDEDFSFYNLEGNGSFESPYLIEGLNITTDSYYGIYIKGVTKYFEIRNNYIDANKVGIYIENTADGVAIIKENVLFNNIDFGIQIIDSDSVKVSKNYCYSSTNQLTNQGISISFSANSLVSNNTSIYQEVRGISVQNSPYSEITSNNCSFNDNFGLFVDESEHLEISDNMFDSNGLNGLSITLSRNTNISKNTFLETGLLFWEYFVQDIVSYTVESNIANGKPLGFYKNLENHFVDTINDGQSFFVNCTNLVIEKLDLNDVLGMTVSFCNNATIKNSDFSYIPRPGLLLWYCVDSLVSNVTCSYNNADGLAVAYSDEITVENGLFHHNSKNGIRLLYSTNSYLYNNTCRFNTRIGTNLGDIDGILVHTSTNSTLVNNICTNNGGDGISLYISENSRVINNTSSMNLRGLNMFMANNSIILNNSFNGDLNDGIYLQPADNITISGNFIGNTQVGISILGASNSKILDNTIINNNQEGIVFVVSILGDSVNNEIHHNLFIDNGQYAIRIVDDCMFTKVHHNAFFNNHPTADSQAWDASDTSLWYDSLSSEGNFWDDWVSGDYSVDGPAENYDIFPLSLNPIG